MCEIQEPVAPRRTKRRCQLHGAYVISASFCPSTSRFQYTCIALPRKKDHHNSVRRCSLYGRRFPYSSRAKDLSVSLSTPSAFSDPRQRPRNRFLFIRPAYYASYCFRRDTRAPASGTGSSEGKKTSPRVILSRISFSRVARNNYHNSVSVVRLKCSST